jgi:hypothetical protein
VLIKKDTGPSVCAEQAKAKKKKNGAENFLMRIFGRKLQRKIKFFLPKRKSISRLWVNVCLCVCEFVCLAYILN